MENHMSLDKHVLWVEKYRPRTLEQYVFQNETHRQAFTRMVRDKSIPQLILAGVQGTGKTTLAQILISAMDLDPADICTINASHERGIDTFREKIYNFATSMALGRFKIVHLEEAERLTPEAQDALKAFMEEVSDSVRFIMTTNHINKLIPPIRSRCQEYTFRAADRLDVTEQMIYMLRDEHIHFKMEALDAYITAGYPDIRKIINLLQQHAVDGTLTEAKAAGSGEWRMELINLIASDDWEGARKLACANVTTEEWEALFKYLYENIASSPKFNKKDKWEEAITLIAEHLYKHTFVADPEINAAALFIRLGQV
jgi:replication factor C small subunit